MKLFVVLSVAVALAAGVPFQKEQKFTRTQRFGKIVGGSDATLGQFPYQVSVKLDTGSNRTHICGGIILDEETILTAGHCVTEGGMYKVYAGLLRHDNIDSNVEIYDVQNIIVHEDYTGGVAPNDITIFKLTKRLVFNDLVNKVNLPAQGAPVPATATLSGWGYTSSSSVISNHLQFIELPIITNQECDAALTDIVGSSEPLNDDMVCTGPLTGGISACGGDSGGPLVDKTTNTLVGVVSWFITPCGYNGAPSVYTRTSSFRDWIDANM